MESPTIKGLQRVCVFGHDAVVSWGGAYAQAVSKGYIEPFMAKTGIEVRLERGPAELRPDNVL